MKQYKKGDAALANGYGLLKCVYARVVEWQTRLAQTQVRVKPRVGSSPTLGTIFDFYKNICYNIYVKIEKGKNLMNYWESFACEIQSDEIASQNEAEVNNMFEEKDNS